MCAAVLPKPMPGSTQIRSRATPAATATSTRAARNARDLLDDVVVARVVLHRERRAEHVHQAEVGAASGDHARRARDRPGAPSRRSRTRRPRPSAARATSAFDVSIEIGTSEAARMPAMTGSTRRASSAAETPSERGRVDSPPTSTIAAPSAAWRRSPSAIAAAGSRKRPPSENESRRHVHDPHQADGGIAVAQRGHRRSIGSARSSSASGRAPSAPPDRRGGFSGGPPGTRSRLVPSSPRRTLACGAPWRRSLLGGAAIVSRPRPSAAPASCSRRRSRAVPASPRPSSATAIWPAASRRTGRARDRAAPRAERSAADAVRGAGPVRERAAEGAAGLRRRSRRSSGARRSRPGRRSPTTTAAGATRSRAARCAPTCSGSTCARAR